MIDWNEIKSQIENIEKLRKLDKQATARLLAEFPGIPSDYISFLEEIGCGNLGSIHIYSGPALCSSIYPERVLEQLSSIVLFADDIQGYCFGFDKANEYRLVEVDPKGTPRISSLKRDFSGLLKFYLSEE